MAKESTCWWHSPGGQAVVRKPGMDTSAMQVPVPPERERKRYFYVSLRVIPFNKHSTEDEYLSHNLRLWNYFTDHQRWGWLCSSAVQCLIFSQCLIFRINFWHFLIYIYFVLLSSIFLISCMIILGRKIQWSWSNEFWAFQAEPLPVEDSVLTRIWQVQNLQNKTLCLENNRIILWVKIFFFNCKFKLIK